MANNSFLLKGWAVTLNVGLFALSPKAGEENILLIALFPVILFWLLDGYFLLQEFLFRELYSTVSKETDNSNINYTLDTSPYKSSKRNWILSMFRPINASFYLILIGTNILMYWEHL